ncbi:alpha-amylase [bacterium]|nr:MAG: alpha-amylase [bacterium]
MKIKYWVGLVLLSWVLITCNSEKPCKPVSTTLSTPEWTKNLSIYELNIRQFSNEGTFKAVENRLDELKAMNVGIIWLMPIHPIGEKNRKGPLGSYYAVKDYKDVSPEYGTKEDFKSLVDAIHAKGMYVIIDWVANHTAWDISWVETNPEFFTKNEKGEFIPPVADWADVIDLNYDNPEMRASMIDALEYWVQDFNIDGYRCDVAQSVPDDFWVDARTKLDAIKPVFMLAEAEYEIHHEKAFDMSYGWEMHHYFNEIAQGKKTAEDLVDLLKREDCRFPKEAYRMRFVDNHDENSWNGTNKERMGDAETVMTVIASTLPGMPLLYSGDEAGMDKRLKFFERDPIEWKEHKNRALYTELFALKKNTPALYNGSYGGSFELIKTDNHNILAFKRVKGESELIVLANLSAGEETMTHTYLTKNKTFKRVLSEGVLTDAPVNGLEMAPWGFEVWLAEN